MSQRSPRAATVRRPRLSRGATKLGSTHGTNHEPAHAETDLFVSRFRLRARIRGAWLQTLWSREGAAASGTVVTPPEMALLLADEDSPAAEQAWSASEGVVQQMMGFKGRR